MGTDGLPPEAECLRPLAKHVYHYLTCDAVGARTRGEIARELGYSERAVGEACNDLAMAGLLRKRLHPNDGRKCLFDPENPDFRG